MLTIKSGETMNSNAIEKRGKTGVLLVNLGSPDSPSTTHIRNYLAEFLSDKRVMAMPSILRWLILWLFILPFRPSAIKSKYQSIWNGKEFPLLQHGKCLVEGVASQLGEGFSVNLAMRYGTPSLQQQLIELQKQKISRLLVFPLFPQYSSATTGSILEKVLRIISSWEVIPELVTVSSYCDEPSFINSWVSRAQSCMEKRPDWILFSFHGLPESHIVKGDISGDICLKTDNCCAVYNSSNTTCYRAQCFQTAREIERKLNTGDIGRSVSFQSRLGRSRWLEPYTIDEVRRLAEQGIKRLMVFCPSFVADCLETTEEILMEVKNEFIAKGGEELLLVPSLNSENHWVSAVAGMIRSRLEPA